MAPATIPTTEPIEVLAGLTWRWDKTVTDYTPATGWAFAYVLRGASALDLAGVANSANSGWEITATAAQTADLAGGLYQWTAYVSSGAEKYIVEVGTLTVLPNPLTAVEAVLQPYAEKALAFVEASLLKRYQTDMSEYTIEQRSTVREEIQKLEATRARLIAEVESKRQRGRFGRRVEYHARSYR